MSSTTNVFAATLAAVGAGALMAKVFPVRESKVETCIQAYYADKYNGVRHGSPSKTFLACMQQNYTREFDELKAKYNAPPPTA